MDDDVPRDLRARRRLATRQQIHRAALEAFEEKGVRETTVPEIAERAGVSTRTFFRYFTTKEEAALPGQRRLLQAIDGLDLTTADPAGALRAVEESTEAVFARENDPELEEHRRIARLLAREPELQAHASAQELALTNRLRTRLAELLPEHEPLTLLLVAQVAVAVWRTSWERWGELAVEGRASDPAELYRQCREELRRVV